MNKFILRALSFFVLVAGVLAFALLAIPYPAIEHNMMSALLDKHKRLEKTPSPRIIFIGGSNLSFGLDSKKIEDRLGTPVVNAGLHAAIGMKYYLNDLKPFIKKGDLVVLSPEYIQFYTDAFYGRTELVCILFDVFKEGNAYMDLPHWCHLAKFIPGYAVSKLKPGRRSRPKNTIGIYHRKAFNEYGDAFIHWSLPRNYVTPAGPVSPSESVREDAIRFVKAFEEYIKAQSAELVIIPPAFQASSYDNQKSIIDSVIQALTKADLAVIARPEKYRLADSLFFDTNYHLTKPGIDIRTDMLVDDLRPILEK